MTRYSIEPRTRKYVKRYGLLSVAKNPSNKYRKQLLDAATKTGLDALKNATKEVNHKVAEGTGEFIRNKIAGKTVKPKPVPNENSENVEEIIIPLEKKRRNTEGYKISIMKWNTNDSTVLKFETKNGSK